MVRDKARHFGLGRRRKVERETQRILRTQCLDQIKQMIGAPLARAPFDALDDAALAVLRVIADAVGRSKGLAGASVTYDKLSGQSGVHRNRLASKLRTLTARGLIEVAHGKRGRNVYRLSDDWRIVGTMQAREDASP